jgi:hypothetical protein
MAAGMKALNRQLDDNEATDCLKALRRAISDQCKMKNFGKTLTAKSHSPVKIITNLIEMIFVVLKIHDSK